MIWTLFKRLSDMRQDNHEILNLYPLGKDKEYTAEELMTVYEVIL
jgi:hypothetical protein